MRFEGLNDFLEWVHGQDVVVFLPDRGSQNFIKEVVRWIRFYDPKKDAELELACPLKKQDNRRFLRVVRKALFELQPKTIVSYDVKSFLNFIPGSFAPACKDVFDVHLLRSIRRDSSFPEEPQSAKGVLLAFSAAIKQLNPRQLRLYNRILSRCIFVYSEMEKNGAPDFAETPRYSYYDLTGTVSGRLTCRALDEQNFINPLTMSRADRGMIVAPQGHKLIISDYNAMEMRMLGHISGDENLTQIFHSGFDLYNIIARYLFGRSILNEEDRQMAKSICFRIIYGGSAYGFAADNQTSVKEAETYIGKFFQLFPKVEEWYYGSQVRALESGLSTSVFGRERKFEIDEEADLDKIARQGQNFEIQSAANDVTLAAIADLWGEIGSARILFHIHDCVVVLAPTIGLDRSVGLIESRMRNPATISEFGINNLYLCPKISVTDRWQ